ncbi:MAG: M48 family metalloprotease [Chthonomonas sp.]|nr:M48 family metalloprotease [Chthonomonas sp.]
MRLPIVAMPLGLAIFTASAQAVDFRPSIKDQIKIGKEASAEIRKKEKVLPDSDIRVKVMRQLGQQLVAKIPEAERKKNPFEYSFDVIDSKEVNAFALPGGPIYFYTGLLNKMKSLDEFAGVLGHEIVHIRNQHWASQEGDRMKRQLPLAILLTIVRAGDFAWDLAGLADAVLIGIKYSQKHESESDRIGFDLMTAAGYNPQGMVDTFKMLSAGRKMSDFDRMLSTHPDPAKRAETLEARIKKEGKVYPPMRPLPFAPQPLPAATPK